MATQLQLQHFAILTITQQYTPTSVIIVVTTNNPCHLTCYFSEIEPKRHPTSRTVRGLALPWGAYWCFPYDQIIEQQEAGDTLIHTFEKPDWLVCQTKWVSFRGTINDELSPSVTAIIKKHRPWTFTAYGQWSGRYEGRVLPSYECWNEHPTIYYYIGSTFMIVSGTSYSLGAQRTHRAITSFNTTTLPTDKPIIEAMFRIKLHAPDDPDPFYLCCVRGDYSLPPGLRDWCNLGDEDEIYASILSTNIIPETFVDLPINIAGRSQINPGGWTKYAWRTSHDIEEWTNPEGHNNLASFEHYDAILIITLPT